jgi:hypothetical protein
MRRDVDEADELDLVAERSDRPQPRLPEPARADLQDPRPHRGGIMPD